ncbi:hypothetical protein BDU57DRAFT_288812 [Ampelomyces quisqualis]|uniref:Secreted protein n=1 Tax=Ampelomyces quisqualis TaxID=50730 RepID=A0A6A5QFV6_AMPQU|nr:hypothetical protein BDU57DRAFT_288812 [Ampelomyces quisqualis]
MVLVQWLTLLDSWTWMIAVARLSLSCKDPQSPIWPKLWIGKEHSKGEESSSTSDICTASCADRGSENGRRCLAWRTQVNRSQQTRSALSRHPDSPLVSQMQRLGPHPARPGVAHCTASIANFWPRLGLGSNVISRKCRV